MYRTLGNFVVRYWLVLFAGWLVALVALKVTAPAWNSVLREGEFAFLPADVPSLRGEKIYEEAWGEPFASNIVLVIRRERTQLTEQDRFFITEALSPELQKIIKEVGLPEPEGSQKAEVTPLTDDDIAQKIKTFATTGMQKILDSSDGTATMVVIDLQTEFFDARNTNLINRIEDLIKVGGPLYEKTAESSMTVPAGLHLALSGSATVGRDMMVAATESSKATELWTTILVVILLIGIYRAPVLAIIPLMTVGVATEFSLALLATLAKYDILTLFNGIEVYVKVLSYGAGVDYCLFLIARFKEELDETQQTAPAVSSAIAKAGEALVASAGTVICGIFMMVFADFGKFQQAGVAITIGLVVVLVASLTFTPSMLRMFGQKAFWPHIASSRMGDAAGWVSATGLFANILRKNVFESVWQKVSDLIQARPGRVLALSIALMAPFSVIAIACFDNLSYGLLTELPKDNASVVGARAIQNHYPAGIAGPATLLLHHPNMDFRSPEGQEAVEKLVTSLYDRRDELRLADIRSVVHPFGIASGEQAADDPAADSPATETKSPFLSNLINKSRTAMEGAVTRQKVKDFYVGQTGPWEKTLTRLDLVSVDDPFSRNSIQQFVELRETVLTQAGKLFDQGAAVTIHAIGPTASIRDLKTVTDRDQRVVDALVLFGIFLILVAVLRQFIVPVYLIVSVFFSYLVTLGVTFAVFWAMDPSGFAGLDWKVPTFLFTILIAVGEDYNIFLMTRIKEEQQRSDPISGVGIALTKTGSIISSCGVIMAGTFSSLMAGTLVGMHQLGFALAFGVLLDTFVVRPILVPAFLVLFYQGRFGFVERCLQVTARAEQHDDVSCFEGQKPHPEA